MNDKQRKSIIELASGQNALSPSVIARLSGVSLAEVTAVLGSDNSGAPRNGAMSTMKFDAGMRMIPEEYSPRGELKDPLRINRDTTSQGTEPWQVQSDHAMDRQQQDLPGFGSLPRGYETSEDRGNPFLQATGSPQFNPHTAGTSHSMVANPPMNPSPAELIGGMVQRQPMDPQRFMQEEMAEKQNSMRAIGDLMNPNVPRQGFDPYMTPNAITEPWQTQSDYDAIRYKRWNDRY